MKAQLLALAVLTCACATTYGDGKTWYVNAAAKGTNDGSTEVNAFTALSSAITASSAGDTIRIVGGNQTQTAEQTLNKAVTILGPGPDQMTLTINKLSLKGGAVLSGFTLSVSGTNGNVPFLLYDGIVTNCVIDNCTGQSTGGRNALWMNGGKLVDCVIKRCHNANWDHGVPTGNDTTVRNGASCMVAGPCTIENCLFADNYRGLNNTPLITYAQRASDRMNGPCGALDIWSTSGEVIIRNCTFAGNKGQRAGAFDVYSGTVKVYDSVFAENMSYSDARNLSDYASDDMYLGAGAVTFENCLISQTPKAPKNATYVNCSNDRAAGFTDPKNSDYTLTLGSPAYGWGYHPGAAPTGFACAIETPTVDRANGSLTVTLKAKLFNPPAGEATYAWDLDGDGTYETTDQGATFDHTFTTPGWNKVGLKVTVGGATKTYAADNFVYIAPSTIYMDVDGSATFPFDTPGKGAKTIEAALTAALDGSFIQVGAGTYSGAPVITKEVTIAADPAAETVPALYGASTAAAGFVLFDHVTLRGFAISGGIPTISIVGNSAVSNCTITAAGNTATATSGKGVCMSAGILSHCSITGCRANNGDGFGVYLGRGTVRNCLIADCGPKVGTGTQTHAPVYVAGGTLENCTIAGNGTALSSATAAKSGGVYLAGTATLVNNVIWGNSLAVSTSDIQKSIVAAKSSYLTGSTIDHNTIQYTTDEAPIGTYCYHADPVFAADYTISTTSGLYDKGTDLAWTATGVDLAGHSRKQGKAVDIGAYEADASVVELDFTVKELEGGVGSTKAEFAVAGDTDGFEPEDIRWDLDGDGEYDDATGFVITNVFGEGRATVGMKYSDLAEPKVRENCIDVKALTVYLAPAAQATNPAYPFNTRATATSVFADAQNACGDGSTVIITEGEYGVYQLGTISKAITVRGEAGASNTLFGPSGSTETELCVTIANPGAVLEGITVRKFRQNAIILNSGTVRNCVVDAIHHSTGDGIGITAYDGLIEKTVICNCHDGSTSLGGNGVAVMLGSASNPGTSYSAVMRNCVVYGTGSGQMSGLSAVYVGKGCLMESCTVANNDMLEPAVKNYGTVRNCVMYGNTAANDKVSAGSPDWSVAGSGTFEHSLGEKCPEGEGNVGGDPDFTDLAHNDFTFTAASPLFNAGLNQTWMSDAVDVAGNVRISGGTVDIGAYEADADAEDVNISVSAGTGVGSLDVALTAVAGGFEMSAGATFAWTVSNRLTSVRTAYTTNPAGGTFGVGTYDVYLTVTDADGEGTNFNRHKKGAFVVYPADLYVTAQTEATPVYPYDTPAKAATNLVDVVAIAYDGATVHFDAGTHYVRVRATTDKAVTFVGAGTGATTLRNPDGVSCGVFSIGNAGAAISNLTITAAAQPIVTIGTGGGTVEAVVFSNLVESATATAGGALRLLGGTAKRCRIVGNDCENSQTAVYMNGESAILENCLLTDNTSTSSDASAAGAVYLAAGTVRCCTIVNNTSETGAGGVRIVPANLSAQVVVSVSHVKSSIVWGNTCVAGTGLSNVTVSNVAYAERVMNSYLYPMLSGSVDCLSGTDDPGFRNRAAGDYRVVPGSAVYKKGLYESWMATAKDLAGNNRIRDSRRECVDMGCYENPYGPGMLLIVR